MASLSWPDSKRLPKILSVHNGLMPLLFALFGWNAATSSLAAAVCWSGEPSWVSNASA